MVSSSTSKIQAVELVRVVYMLIRVHRNKFVPVNRAC